MKALIVVDMQNDFMPSGALPTKGADALVPVINRLIDYFPLVLATQDWHPKDHNSFAVNHPEYKVGDVIREGAIEQILWPVHCVQNTKGAEFVKGLRIDRFERVFHKGIDRMVDSYSTFFDNAHLRETGLAEYLHKRGIKEIAFVGVATDYCVLYSVLDALELGFQVMVFADGCRAINLRQADGEEAFEKMTQAGAVVVTSSDFFSSEQGDC
ncbi:MAG: bifunctional nicotinamidase/pyrazinamidase [Verrucomicrobia bacterium]|nr:bifunctional nicotinamidase/pyrazinamidase [Verrucomicrobiota bacterium]